MPEGRLIVSLIGSVQKIKDAEDEYRRCEKLGFWGAGNDFNTFNPSVSSKDFTPKDEDFIRVPFRLLSATIVAGGSWRATRFPEAVLRASMQKLVSKPIYVEHEDEIGNEHGVIESVEWQAGYRDEANSIDVPPGIVGILKIDAKANPKTARNLLSDPPAIFSDSVTLDYSWEPSHDFESNYEFEDRIGEFDEEGKMFTRDATVIHDYAEVSLVPLGADPFAKKIQDGKVHLPDTTRAVLSKMGVSEKDVDKAYNSNLGEDRRSYASTGDLRVTYSFSRETGTNAMEKLLKTKKTKSSNTTDMKDKLMLAILAVMGFENADKFLEHFGLSEEDLEDNEKVKGIVHLMKVEDYTTLKAQADESGSGDDETLKTELSNSKKTIITLKKENDTFKEDKPEADRNAKLTLSILKLIGIDAEKFAEVGEFEKVEETLENFKTNSESYGTHLEKLKKEVTKFANLASGGKAEDVILTSIEDCENEEELMAMARMYGNKSIGLFTVKLDKDGKAVIRSSVELDDEEGPSGEDGPLDREGLIDKYSIKTMNPSIIGQKQSKEKEVV